MQVLRLGLKVQGVKGSGLIVNNLICSKGVVITGGDDRDDLGNVSKPGVVL